MRLRKTALVAATVVLAGWIATVGTASADPPPPPPSINPVEPRTTIDSDGTFVVGTDIVAGTYSSAGPVGDGTCYWKRQGSLDGTAIVIDNAMSKQAQVVQIDPSDAAFKTNGCQPWQQTDPVSAGPQVPDALAALIARAKLGNYIDTINAGARQHGDPELPRP